MSRLWTITLPLVLLCGVVFQGAVRAEKAPMLGAGHFEVPAWFKNSFLDLRADAEEGAAQGKRLMLMFHQDGCPYCAKLVNDNFTQPEILEYLRARFEAVEINIWGDREVTDFDGEGLNEKTFAAKHKVWATPTLLFFDEQGRQVLRLDGYYAPPRLLTALRYVGEKQEQQQSFREYYARHYPPSASGSLPGGTFFAKPPYNLPVDAAGKPVAVFFEQKDCADCQTLHKETLDDAGTQEKLGSFYAVQLDRWAETPLITPDGTRTTAKAWADALSIAYVPALVLFDKGEKIMQMDALVKAYHMQGILEYVASGAYRQEPNFQRYLHDRSERLREQGKTVNMWQ